MKKALKPLLMAGLALGSFLPMAKGEASATNKTSYFKKEIVGENYKISQRLANVSSPGINFNKITFDINASEEGISNLTNQFRWVESVDSNMQYFIITKSQPTNLLG